MPEVSKINFKLSEAYKNFEHILDNFQHMSESDASINHFKNASKYLVNH